MSNTIIQIKRSNVTQIPPNGSLAAGELAISYSSNVIYSGTSDGNGVIPLGGLTYVNKTNSAFDIAVAAYNTANLATANAGTDIAIFAFDKANAANLLAYNTGIGANAFTSATIAGANTAVGAGANAYANLVWSRSNTYASAVGTAANTYLLTVIDGANTAVGTGANTYSNATFEKLVGSQTISGDISITGNLIVTGNSTVVSANNLSINDPFILLANNNVGDALDIGLTAHYANDTSEIVHTGIYRSPVTKEWYLFKDYNKHFFYEGGSIDRSANNFTIDVLNTNLRTDNIILSGINVTTWITSAFNKANSANLLAYETGIGANAFTSATIAGANTAVGAGANSYADLVGAAANTNAANASYLSTGTVPSARISGSYTGITGVGTIIAGTWNGSTVTVPYGGTGQTTFTTNGVLYGAGASALNVTSAGTEGKVLQANATGVPVFDDLDGGTF